MSLEPNRLLSLKKKRVVSGGARQERSSLLNKYQFQVLTEVKRK